MQDAEQYYGTNPTKSTRGKKMVRNSVMYSIIHSTPMRIRDYWAFMSSPSKVDFNDYFYWEKIEQQFAEYMGWC